jgi:hypothetical protein
MDQSIEQQNHSPAKTGPPNIKYQASNIKNPTLKHQHPENEPPRRKWA